MCNWKVSGVCPAFCEITPRTTLLNKRSIPAPYNKRIAVQIG